MSTIPKVAHALIVGAAAAAHCDAKGRRAEAVALIGLVWEHLHAWLRTWPVSFDDPHARLAVIYVWAYAGKILGASGGPQAATGLTALRTSAT